MHSHLLIGSPPRFQLLRAEAGGRERLLSASSAPHGWTCLHRCCSSWLGHSSEKSLALSFWGSWLIFWSFFLFFPLPTEMTLSWKLLESQAVHLGCGEHVNRGRLVIYSCCPRGLFQTRTQLGSENAHSVPLRPAPVEKEGLLHSRALGHLSGSLQGCCQVHFFHAT